MSHPVRFVGAFLALSLLTLAMPSEATVVVVHDLEEMSRRAEVIVHARVADQRVLKEEGRIITLTDIEVIDGLKGAKAGDVLTIYQVGGTLDGVTAWIAGAQRYEVGEEMILFAMRHGERIVSYGVGVGKFNVIYDGALRKVVEDIHGVVEMRREPSGEVRMVPPQPRVFPSLDRFKEEVRRHTRKESLPRVMKPTRRMLGSPDGKLEVRGEEGR